MSFNHSIAVRTHTGRVADRNEDYYVVDEELGAFFLADGMGGHVAGHQASRLACRAAYAAYHNNRSLVGSIEAAHAAVLKAIADNHKLQGMGTTLLATVFDGNEFELAWVGDSRAYRWRQGRVEQLSRDHNYAQTLIDSGMSVVQAWQDFQAARLTQAVGVRADMLLGVDAINAQLFRDELLLLCSDGLTDELSDAEIAALIDTSTPAETICERLLQAALDKGGRDNITILLIAAAPTSPARPETPPRAATTRTNLSK